MKQIILTLCLGMVINAGLFAQGTLYNALNYQAVARDASGSPIANQSIGLKFDITAGPGVIYSETHSATTNDHGLFSVAIGTGTPNGFPPLEEYSWYHPSNNMFIMVYADFSGGTNYQFLGQEAIRSVPSAFTARQANTLLDSAAVVDPDQDELRIKAGYKVGVGTNTPDTTLHVVGKLKYQDGTEADKRILTSDAQGNASWEGFSTETLFGVGNVPAADLSCMETIANIATGVAPFSVAVSGDHAYVVNAGSSNMTVFDISNTASPSLSATLATGSDPVSVAISGDHAYVVNYISNNMMVFDISNPATPSLSANIATGSAPRSVAVSGDHAYVVNSLSDNMIVFDISNPASPSLSATISTGSDPVSVAISGNHAYVVNYNSNSMMVFDISNPVSPSLSATMVTGVQPLSVAVSGNHAYVVNSVGSSMMVFDISNPSSPSPSATIATGSFPYSVAVAGNHAYVVNYNSNNMMVFDISNPASPNLIATIATGSDPFSVVVSGKHAYVVNGGDGDMMVFKLFCDMAMSLDPNTGEIVMEPTAWEPSGDNIFNTNSGNVGIGVDDPAVPLEVKALNGGDEPGVGVRSYNAVSSPSWGSGMSFALNNSNDEKTTYGRIYGVIGDNTAGQEDGWLQLGHRQNGTLVYPLFVRDQSVGIGTTSPSYKLDVTGDVRVQGHSYSNRYAFTAYGQSVVTPTGLGGPLKVPFYFETTDPFAVHMEGGSSYFNAPRAGLYYLTTTISFDGGDGSDDTIYMGFSVNGNGLVASTAINPRALSGPGVEVSITYAEVMQLNTNDQVKVVLEDIGSTPVFQLTNRTFSGYYLGE